MNKVWMLLGSIGFFPCLGWSSSPQADSGTLPLTAAVKPSVSQQAAKLLPQDATLPSNQDDAAVSEDLLTKQTVHDRAFPEDFLKYFEEKKEEYLSNAVKSHNPADYYLAIDCELFLMTRNADAYMFLEKIELRESSYGENKKEYDNLIQQLVSLITDKRVAHDWASKIGHNYLHAYGPRSPKIALWNAIEIALRSEEPSA